jgi:hypothetical protein
MKLPFQIIEDGKAAGGGRFTTVARVGDERRAFECARAMYSAQRPSSFQVWKYVRGAQSSLGICVGVVTEDGTLLINRKSPSRGCVFVKPGELLPGTW